MTSCEVCGIHDASAPGYAQRFAPLEAWRGPRWIVRHHLHPAPLVGWTFLCAARHVQGAADFDDGEAEVFGGALRTVSRAVRALSGCDRVYAIAFGQGAPHLHVHLIPRYTGDQVDPRGGVRWIFPERADYWSARGGEPV